MNKGKQNSIDELKQTETESNEEFKKRLHVIGNAKTVAVLKQELISLGFSDKFKKSTKSEVVEEYVNHMVRH